MKKKNILIVEDENIIAKDIENTLNKLGYAVSGIAGSGKKAIEKTTNHNPDLILMDTKLKGNLDGIETAKVIQSKFDIPIIYLLSYAGEELIERTKETKPEGYILKPFSERKLHTAIEIAFSKFKLKKALKKSEEKYRTLVENLNIGVYRSTAGLNGKFISVNPVFVKMFGYKSADELMKIPISKHCASSAKFVEFDDKLKKRRYVKNEVIELNKKNGDTFWGSFTSTAQYDNIGKIKWIDGVLEDITETTKIKKEKEKLQILLLQSQKMESLGRLAGGVAHEFNNMLTAIIGFTDLVLMQLDEDSPLRAELKSILEVSKKGSSISNQLLTFSHRRKVQFNHVNINEHIKEIEKNFHHIIGENIGMQLSFDPNLKKIETDKDLFEQLIINLVINAKEAMPEGGELTIKTENITITKKECSDKPDAYEGEFVRLSIIDNGIGLSQEIMHRMFEPFFCNKISGEGLGLGLSVVYGIVKQHNGWLDIKTKRERGTTFMVYFPTTSSEVQNNNVQITLPFNVKTRGENILIVEDEPIVLELTAKILRTNGFVVFEAKNPIEALDIFEKEGRNFKLAVCDIVMPYENGTQLAQKLLSRKPDLKIIFTSGYSEDRSHRLSIIKNGFPFLQKPFTPSDLLLTVEACLNGRQESKYSYHQAVSQKQ
jgi:two-component system cell cycle sensor histidine kinase/response regulator CckA